MPRYILIDNYSGYIFGDTADYGAGHEINNPIDATRVLDESIGEHGRVYHEWNSKHALASSATGYHVYRADIEGSESVPVVHDGQDQATIDEVERLCEYVSTVTVEPANDA